LLRNGFYNGLGGIVRIGLSLVTVPLLIHFLGLSEYGLWVLVSSAVAVVVLAEGGLTVTTTVFVARDLGQDNTLGISQTLTVTAVAILSLATAAALGLWVGAEQVVNLFGTLTVNQRAEAVLALQVSGLVVWTRLVQQGVVGLAQAFQYYGGLNLLNTLQVTLTSLGLIGIAGSGGRTVALMQWQAVVGLGLLVAYLGLGWWWVRGLGLQWCWDWVRAEQVLRYSGLTWLSSVGTVLFSQGDRLVVGAFLGTGLLGVYAAITSVVTQINTLSALIVQPLLPALSTLRLQPEAMRQKAVQALQINALVALGLGAVLFALAPWILMVLIPTGDAQVHLSVLRLMTVIYALYSLCAVGYYVLFGLELVQVNTFTVLAFGGLSLVGVTLGAQFGLFWVAMGNSAYLGNLLLNTFGLGQLGLSGWQWLKELVVPLACFAVGVSLVLLLPPVLAPVVLVLQAITFGLWFARQGYNFSQVRQ